MDDIKIGNGNGRLYNWKWEWTIKVMGMYDNIIKNGNGKFQSNI